jgi:hypothetical protein
VLPFESNDDSNCFFISFDDFLSLILELLHDRLLFGAHFAKFVAEDGKTVTGEKFKKFLVDDQGKLMEDEQFTTNSEILNKFSDRNFKSQNLTENTTLCNMTFVVLPH